MKQGKRRNGLMSVIDNLIWAGIGALFVIILNLEAGTLVKVIYLGIILVFSIFYLWIVYYKATNEITIASSNPASTNSVSHISELLLLNEEHQVLKQWSLTGRAGLVIGKNTENNRVDIDLSDTALAALISDEHALLNYTGENWFVEDFDSEQGTGIQKYNEVDINYLNKSEPVKLDIGDLIYIGKTILQVK
ncbi:FHA domain-containing protein [Anaeromicropila populeti]|uniref:FHA domain-containing protein n=1 Tax=Anaeromicropila populeti TaxID=37658 RepID=A0A1I6L1W2_9FIRM|nr:FHA domain-containing protein [Anaeromicropila populeti]SFR97493.1 FHA domain-containing protein [Anaeromicropila populeti]